jgi:hypothetical protein
MDVKNKLTLIIMLVYKIIYYMIQMYQIQVIITYTLIGYHIMLTLNEIKLIRPCNFSLLWTGFSQARPHCFARVLFFFFVSYHIFER